MRNTTSFYDNDADSYDSSRFSSSIGRHHDICQKQTVLTLAEPLNGRVVLDVGCGTGRFSLIEALEGAEVVGVDFSGAMLTKLGSYAKERGLYERINPVRMDASNLSFSDNVFDVCTCINFFHLVDDMDAMLVEIGRVLKDDGLLIFNFPNLAGFYLAAGAYVRITKRAIGKDVRSSWYTYRSVKRSVLNAGFEISDIRGHALFLRDDQKSLNRIISGLDMAFRESLLSRFSGSIFIKANKRRK